MGIRRSAVVAIACAAGACSVLVDQSGLQDGDGDTDGGASSSSSSASSGGSSGGASSSSASSSSGATSSSSGSTSSGVLDAASDGKVCRNNGDACAAMAECCSGKCGGDRKCKSACSDVGSVCFPVFGACCLGAYCNGTTVCAACRPAGQNTDPDAQPASSSCCSGTANNGKCT